MKLWIILSKNFKLLLRAKGAAFVVVLGPLLIVLLVGLAFNNTSSYDISVGLYAEEYTELAQSFINILENEDYAISYYDTEDSCVEAIKIGEIHTCVVFPDDFVVENNVTKTIKFFVDYTRINLARVVIDSISTNIELRSTQLSYNLTDDILEVLTDTRLGIQDNIGTAEDIKEKLDGIASDANSIQGSVDDINLSVDVPSISTLESNIDSVLSKGRSVKSKAEDVIESGYVLIDSISNSSLAATLEDDLDTLNSSISGANYTAYELDIDSVLDSISDDLDDVEDQLSDADAAKSNIKTSVDSLRSSLTGLKDDMDGLKESQQNLVNSINALQVSSAETIVSPVATEITSVVPENTRLSYLMPDLFVLIIMFIGILLSSTLLVLEKNSKAFFRNFTTPTSPQYFMMTTFLTSFFIILIQIVAILAISFFFLRGPFFDNVLLTLVILCLSISLFTLIGMIIGYVFSNQETVMVASIVLGSLFLFLSNLILPLESMANIIQTIAAYNPFIIFANLLRQSLLFEATFESLMTQLYAMLGVVIVFFVVIAGVQRLSNMRFFMRLPHIKGETDVFRLKDKEIKNQGDLLDSLEKMSDDDFRRDVLQNKKDFVKGIRLVIHDAKLRVNIKTKITRQRMIDVLENYDKKIKK